MRDVCAPPLHTQANRSQVPDLLLWLERTLLPHSVRDPGTLFRQLLYGVQMTLSPLHDELWQPGWRFDDAEYPGTYCAALCSVFASIAIHNSGFWHEHCTARCISADGNGGCGFEQLADRKRLWPAVFLLICNPVIGVIALRLHMLQQSLPGRQHQTLHIDRHFHFKLATPACEVPCEQTAATDSSTAL